MNTSTITTATTPPLFPAEHCRMLMDSMRNFFASKENQQEFEVWHLAKYGHPPRHASYINPAERRA